MASFPLPVIFDKTGALYGTTQYGGDTSCQSFPFSLPGCGTVFKLTPPSTPGGPWTETILHNFAGGSGDGAEPLAGLISDSTGALYGTTRAGGSGGSGFGTVFKLTPPSTPGGPWTKTILHNFAGSSSDGANPYGGLISDSTGALYGTTFAGGSGGSGGSGTAFKLTPPSTPGGPWTETVLHSFNLANSEGGGPEAGLILDSTGALYGTTPYGGDESCPLTSLGCGTVFKLIPPSTPGGAWTEIVLHNFAGGNGDGALPGDGLILDSNGALYGTTIYGGNTSCSTISPSSGSGCGIVFKLTPPSTPGGAWTETVLHSFNFSDGARPQAPQASLILDRAGTLYGTTFYGGKAGCSTIFDPTVSGCGTVFKLAPPSTPGAPWTETVLYIFNISDGAEPLSGLISDSSGALYGTTSNGGNTNCSSSPTGCGTVFQITGSGFVPPAVFAGTPGKANCHGQSVSALARQYGGLNGAAAVLDYATVNALQEAIESFCGG